MKKKKRLLGILLSLALVLGLMPGMSLTAYADDPYASLKNTTTEITFDGNSWYLIDYDANTVTLLAKECVGVSAYNSSGSFVEYSQSIVKTVVDTWYNGNITADAKTAVSGGGMFLLTALQAQTIYNATVNTANFDVLKCSKATGAYANVWWLCSQGAKSANNAAYVDGGTGWVNSDGGTVTYTLGVRPALKLNLSSVTFSSESKTFSPKPSHTHSFNYAASGATITATCSNTEGCPLSSSEYKATLTIAAPAKTAYGDANSAEATITDASSIKGDATIQYQTKSGSTYGTATTNAPTDAGDYKASITVGGATASVEYTIAKAPETAPSANTDQLNIDYTEETISAKNGYEVAADSNGTAISNVYFSAILDNAAPTVYIRKTASDANHNPSAWVAVTLTARPAAPTGLGSSNSTNETSADGTITNVNDTMEYSADGTNWTAVTGTPITGLNPGTYSVRVKATDSAPHGVAATVTIGSNYVAQNDSNKPTISVSGSHNPPVVEDTLTASTTATDIVYEWYRDGVKITGATSSTYTLTADDVGKAITVKATQTKKPDGTDYAEGSRPAQTSDATAAVVKKSGPAAPSSATVAGFTPNYTEETFTVGDNYEVSSTNNDTGLITNSSLTEAIDGTGKVYIRVKETADTKAGAWLEVNLPSRPAAPTGLTTTSASNDSTADGKINSTTSHMEYKLKDSTDAWTTAGDSKTAVVPGTYLVRVKATASTPCGLTCEVTVGNKEIILADSQKPTAKEDIVFNGSEQALVDAPKGNLPQGATEIQYALGKDDVTVPTSGWSTEIPTGKEEGTYYVWYKAIGDADHTDSKPVCIVVKIVHGEIKTNVTQEDNTPKADVSGLDSDLAESVMNEDEKAQLNSGANMTLTLEMTNIDQTVKEDEKKLTEDALKKVDKAATVGMYFDISLILRLGANYQRSVTEMGNKAITVKFEIPQNLRAAEGVSRTFYLMHIHQGVARQIASTKSDNMQVSLNQLSTFALAYSDENGGDSANTGFYSGLKITQKKGKIKVSWDKTEGVSKYGVFITYCGKDYPAKAVKTTKNNSVTFKKINGKKIDFTKNIKMYVEAFDNNGASVGKSITGHVAGKNSKKNKNPKSISVSNKNLTLSTGATSKIKATVKMEKGDKKALKDDHVAKLRYRSTDERVAKVDKNGKVTAVGAGACQIYVYAKNGLAVKVSVTVN